MAARRGTFALLVLVLVLFAAFAPPTASAWGNPTTTSIASSANPSFFGQSASLTARVTSDVQGDPAMPTGKVAFKESGKVIAIVALSDGVATLNTSSLAVGNHNITATYSGDANHAPSISQALEQDVIEPVVTFEGSPQQPLTTNGDFLAYVTITNTGNATVDSVQVTTATLGSGSLHSAPAPLTNLEPGQRAVVTLTFPSRAVSSTATTAPLKLSFTYSVKNPALSGTWTLNFPSVSLH